MSFLPTAHKDTLAGFSYSLIRLFSFSFSLFTNGISCRFLASPAVFRTAKKGEKISRCLLRPNGSVFQVTFARVCLAICLTHTWCNEAHGHSQRSRSIMATLCDSHSLNLSSWSFIHSLTLTHCSIHSLTEDCLDLVSSSLFFLSSLLSHFLLPLAAIAHLI